MRTIYEITITIRAPFLTRSSSPGEAGIDAPLQRSPDDAFFILPGPLVRGNLLEAWQELADEGVPGFTQVKDAPWFKVPGDAEKPNPAAILNTDRSKVKFDDFECQEKGGKDRRFRISIDDDRGAVKESAYQVIESPWPAGHPIGFKGLAHADLGSVGEKEKNVFGQRLRVAIEWAASLGAHRTSGFGRVLAVKVVDVSNEPRYVSGTSAPPPPLASIVPAQDAEFTLVVRPCEPFCIARAQPAQNLFESLDYIPGNVIKGALAAVLGAKAPLLDGLTITHAYPGVEVMDPAAAKPWQRAVVAPQSLVRCGVGLIEAAHQPGPFLVDGRAPAFAIDWKDDSDIREATGWPLPAKDLRVRTAIHHQKRAAADHKLFAQERIVPNGPAWVARVIFGHAAAADRKAICEALSGISTLEAIGKTKARANVSWVPGPPGLPTGLACTPRGSPYSLTLQSDAVLFDAAKLQGPATGRDLRQIYASFWATVSTPSKGGGPALQLKTYFARQRMAGGEYLRRRFGASRPYHPFILTEAGSVFVLDALKANEADALVETWRCSGLPLSTEVENAYITDPSERWKYFPYLPENGFGEIVVNLGSGRWPTTHDGLKGVNQL